ncbi:MAG: hypothetical protein K1V95_00255 [Eubacterium sp.]
MAELNVRITVEKDGKEAEPFTGFSDKEKDALSKRLSSSMSAYYTAHYNEFFNIK